MKNLSFLSNDMFLSLIKSIVPLHVLNDDRFQLCRQTFIGTKLNPFKEKLRKFQKTKSKLESFLNEEFVFLVNRESPRKKALKKVFLNCKEKRLILNMRMSKY